MKKTIISTKIRGTDVLETHVLKLTDLSSTHPSKIMIEIIMIEQKKNLWTNIPMLFLCQTMNPSFLNCNSRKQSEISAKVVKSS